MISKVFLLRLPEQEQNLIYLLGVVFITFFGDPSGARLGRIIQGHVHFN